MNTRITKTAFLWYILMVSTPAGSASAALVYVLGAEIHNDIAATVSYLGAAAEDSANPWRWYWSYADRFDIEFEAVSGSADIADGSDWTAVSNALATWEAVPNASITSSLDTYDGEWGSLNGDNELAWVESDWGSVGGFGFGSNTIAAAVTWYYPSTLIQIETDIFFNGENFTWYTDTDDSGAEQQFVEHIALHELGHAFSLKDLYDSADTGRTMYGYSGYRDEDGTLQAGDLAALQYAYAPEPTTLVLLVLGSLTFMSTRKG